MPLDRIDKIKENKKNMNEKQEQELQCQSLLAIRFAQKKVHCEPYEDGPTDLTYILLKTDPIPLGLTEGEFLYGSLEQIENCSELLPIFNSTGS